VNRARIEAIGHASPVRDKGPIGHRRGAASAHGTPATLDRLWNSLRLYYSQLIEKGIH
jgi:hypothetical protein